MEKGSLLLFAVAVCLVFALRRHNGISLGVALAMVALVFPAAYLFSRRVLEKARQRETEVRLAMHTKTYLESEQPLPGEPDIQILARALDWRNRAPQGFCKSLQIAPVLRVAEPVVFDALPWAAAVPAPSVALGEILPEPPSAEWGVSKAGPAGPVIEYSNAMMDEIDMRAAEGYQRMRHGGVEVGGVLFGFQKKGALRIVAARALECEYSNGPRFVLSPRDEAALAAMLRTYAGDPQLADLEPVGFYHSNTREEIKLSEVDLRLFERFFPKAWQVALVVRPANLAPTRMGFFVRQ
ncbi:MAG: hypothetical protein ACLP59_14800 [Bryobacteraceae bacterium]